MTTKVAPDGTPEATDVWRRYRTDGALASACVRTRTERDETARVREQVRPIESIRARIRRFGVAMVDARRRRDARTDVERASSFEIASSRTGEREMRACTREDWTTRARGVGRGLKRNETRRKKGWVTDS